MTLDQLREKAENATPGPWVLDTEECSVVVWRGGLPVFVAETWEQQDSDFVAAFNPEVALAFVEYVQAHQEAGEAIRAGTSASDLVRTAKRFNAAEARLLSLLGEQP